MPFRISRYGSLAQNTYKVTGANLLTNGNFEANSFTGWATSTNWTVTASGSTTPTGNGAYCAAATRGATSTLESNKINVTAGNSYVLMWVYGADGSPKVKLWPNNLSVFIRFFDVSNNFISEYQIRVSRIKGNNTRLNNDVKRFTVPVGGAKVSVKFVNRHSPDDVDTPDATILDDIKLISNTESTSLPFIDNIVPFNDAGQVGFTGLKYTHSYRSGYKDASFVIHGSPDYLWNWIQNALGNHIEIYYDAECVFEGLVWDMDATINGYQYSISYDQLFNHITVNYGENGDAYRLVDNDSVARHGVKMLIDEADQDELNKAIAKAESLMMLHSNPLPRIDTANVGEDNSLTVTCEGYIATLQWTYLAPQLIGIRDSSEYIATANISEGASVLTRVRDDTVNDFISNDYSLVETTGVDVGPPEDRNGKTSIDFINDLLDLGDSTGKVLVSGLTHGRYFYMKARPRSGGYFAVPSEEEGKLNFFTYGLSEIKRPLVKSGEFVRFSRPIPTLQSFGDILLDPAAVFIKEIEYDAEKDSIRITTPNSDPLDVSVARLFRRRR